MKKDGTVGRTAQRAGTPSGWMTSSQVGSALAPSAGPRPRRTNKSTWSAEQVTRTVNWLLVICCLGVLGRGGILGWEYYVLHRTDRAAQVFLKRVWERQEAFRRSTDRYAGTLEALHMRAPEGPGITLKLVAYNRPGRQGFLVEHCTPVGCQSMDQTGRMRTAVRVSSASAAGTVPPTPEEGNAPQAMPLGGDPGLEAPPRAAKAKP